MRSGFSGVEGSFVEVKPTWQWIQEVSRSWITRIGNGRILSGFTFDQGRQLNIRSRDFVPEGNTVVWVRTCRYRCFFCLMRKIFSRESLQDSAMVILALEPYP